MKMDRGVLFLALPLVLTAVLAAEARILGSQNPRKSDCYLVFEGITATSPSRPNKVECRDNDPCDGDTTPGQCTFNFTACVLATDTGIAGCNPGTVTKITPTRKHGTTINYPPLPASSPACASTPTSIVLGPLRHNGKPSKAVLNFAATATGKPKRDNDRLILICNASPSGAFVMREE